MSEYTPADNAEYHTAIRMLEFNDLVEGGFAGIDNIPNKQLADNITHLLRRIEILEADVGGTTAPTPPDTGSGTAGGTNTTPPDTTQPIDAPTNRGTWKLTGKANTSFAVGSTPTIIMTNPEYINRDIEWESYLVNKSNFGNSSGKHIAQGTVTTNDDGAAMFSIGRIPTLPDNNPAISWAIAVKYTRTLPGGSKGITEYRWPLNFVQDNSPVSPTNAVE